MFSNLTAAAIEVRLDRSLRSKLMEMLAEAGIDDRKLFAQIAVEEMIYAYDDQLHRLSTDSDISEQRALQWASGIGSYLDMLNGVLARLPTVTRVEVIAERIGPLRLIVGDTPVVISGPDFARQESLEATIFDTYCLRSYCNLEDDDIVARVVREARSSRGFWSISDRHGSVYRTDDGLNFLFADLSDLAQKKSLSEKLVVDLRVVAGSLSHLREQAFPIVWDHVQLQSGSRPGEARLLLNDRDDYLVITLDVLHESAPIWLQARNWVRAKAEGRFAEVYFRDVETLAR